MKLIQYFKDCYTIYKLKLIIKYLIKSIKQDIKDNTFYGICWHLNRKDDKYINLYKNKYRRLCYYILRDKFIKPDYEYGNYWFLTRPYIKGNGLRLHYLQECLINIETLYRDYNIKNNTIKLTKSNYREQNN